MWEDPMNKGGGRWVLNLDKRQRLNELNVMWLETVISSLSFLISSSKLIEAGIANEPG